MSAASKPLKPGRALDRQVHQRIMRDAAFLDRLASGHPAVPRYSTTLDAAWLVMVQLRDRGFWLHWHPSETRIGCFTATIFGRCTANLLAPREQLVAIDHETIPMATCLAALCVADLHPIAQPKRPKRRRS